MVAKVSGYPFRILVALLALSLASHALSAELDYSLADGKFSTSEGLVPSECFAQLITELNGDNVVAAIYLNRNAMRGCISASIPYPNDRGARISYTVEEALPDHRYRLTVCASVDGTMRVYCDRLVVKFVNRDYRSAEGQLIEVLSLEKVGEW